MGMAWGFAPPLIIEAAVKNGFFDALAGSPMYAEELASVTGASVRGVRAVMDALVGFALAARDREGRYVLTAESDAYLVSARPTYFGAFFRHVSEDLMDGWLQLSDAVKTGRPRHRVNLSEDGAEFFSGFVDALFPVNYGAARVLARTLPVSEEGGRVLDVAAGSGVWGIAAAQAHPNLRVTAVDWAPVLEIAKRTAERYGLADRFTFVAGDILEVDPGEGYDAALLGHILHSEGEARSRKLLARVYQALRPGGVIAIQEFLVNEDRTGPPSGLIFAVNMLVNTDEGATWSFEEIGRWLAEAGFVNARLLEAPGPSPLILADKQVAELKAA